MGDDIRSPNTVKHEYGHAVHFDQIGIIKYTAYVAIPSLIGFWTRENDGINDTEEYFWEYTADVLGGVEGRNYFNWAEKLAKPYWWFTILAP